jgi:DNA-binding protein H-NS
MESNWLKCAMEKLELEAMALDDLWSLHERISKLLSERIIAEKRQLEARLVRLNRGQAAGDYQLERVKTKQERPRRKYPKVFPKYQNPKAPFETWAGRGKQPRWLVSALKAGGKVGDFEIPVAVRGRTRAKVVAVQSSRRH